MGRGRKYLSDRQGAAAVEFALVSPVLLIFLLGIIAFGLYFVVAHNVQEIAAEAARATVPGLSATERAKLADTQVANSIDAYPLLRRENLTLSVEPVAGDANLYKIVVSYDASYLGLWGLADFVPLPPPTIERGAVIRRGGY